MAISEIKSGRYLDINEAFLQTMGYARNEVIGRTSLELNLFADPGQRTLLLDRMQRDSHVRNAEIVVRAKSGEIRHGLFSVEFIQLQNKKLLLTVMNDITERRTAEEALRQSKAQLELFFAQSLDGFFFMMLDQPHNLERYQEQGSRAGLCVCSSANNQDQRCHTDPVQHNPRAVHWINAQRSLCS